MLAMSFPYYRIIQCNYPITCCTRLRYFAGMGFSSFQTIFMGLLPVWLRTPLSKITSTGEIEQRFRLN